MTLLWSPANRLQQALVLLATSLAAPMAIAEATAPKGHEVYMRNHCFVCHGQLGYGGAGPRFRGNKLLTAEDYVVSQILLGRGIMPSFAKTMSDEEIAAVATYIRNSWGNEFGSVAPKKVAQIRETLAAVGEKESQEAK